jgi:hypothetical protein
VLRAAACWERIAPWPRPPLPRSDPPADAPVRAGMRIETTDGRVVVRRAYSPADGEVALDTEPV